MTYGITCTADDEALARALQEEYEKEYRRRSMQQHLRQVPTPSAPVGSFISSSTPNPPSTAPSYQQSQNRIQLSSTTPNPTNPSPQIPVVSTRQRSTQDTNHTRQSQVSSSTRQPTVQSSQTSSKRYPSVSNAPITQSTTSRREVASIEANNERRASRRRSELDDEEFARQLDQQIRAQEEAESRKRSSTRASQISRTPSTSRSSSRHMDDGVMVVGGRMLSDEEIARRMAQEERDAALARSMQVDTNPSNNNRNAVVPKKKVCGLNRNFLSYLLTFSMLAIAGGMLYWYFAPPDSLPDFIPDTEMFRKEDPFSSMNATDANRWKNKGKGLELTVINALDTIWNDYFYQAVTDWDSGNPDSLNLQTQLSTPESVCSAVDGVIKVCNGNYGATNWRGINKVLLENGFIYASAARMNEFYFSGTDQFQRQYTMCHEMGHGFGLPHSDENFYNKDLGNCMDYTNNPKSNMQPDDTNYKFLADLYGTFDGAYVPTNDTAVESSAVIPDEGGATAAGHAPKNNDNNRRKANRKLAITEMSSQRSRIIQLSDDLDSFVDETNIRQTRNGWRRLQSSKFVEEYEVDLGDGYTVQFHMLLANS